MDTQNLILYGLLIAACITIIILVNRTPYVISDENDKILIEELKTKNRILEEENSILFEELSESEILRRRNDSIIKLLGNDKDIKKKYGVIRASIDTADWSVKQNILTGHGYTIKDN